MSKYKEIELRTKERILGYLSDGAKTWKKIYEFSLVTDPTLNKYLKDMINFHREKNAISTISSNLVNSLGIRISYIL